MNYIDDKYYKSDITAKIIQAAYRVHNNLGTGFQEVIYQRALEIEFGERIPLYKGDNRKKLEVKRFIK
jgi:GxxExxY protein